ncbi:MAG: hypothetical protein M1827_006257 [Pycnora praestabilis]|nr:MAG: hypothetical protein M1827_006257 [Pycnora praestabilis]
MFWSTLLGTFFTLACAVTNDFTVFYAFRALMGFTLTAYQAVGLSVIKDMFFYHEHARKIGIWVALFVMSPYVAPLFGNFIIGGTGSWRGVFWMVFGTCVLDLILIVLFADESWYNRNLSPEQQPPRGPRLMRIIGIWQIQNHKAAGFFTVLSSFNRLLSTFLKPVIIPSMLYYMMSFMWSVGINITSSLLFETPIAEGGYGFGPNALGYLYFTPIVAVALGETFGHFFNDFLAARYVRKHNGHFKPEARLWTNYISACVMIPGLILVGQALQKHFNYGVIVIGWGLYVFGVMTASVAITAYALDSYPGASGEVAGLLNFARTVGGFTVGYFQQPWGLKSGFGVSFGVQAAIVAAAMVVLICIQQWGPLLRHKGGRVAAATYA